MGLVAAMKSQRKKHLAKQCDKMMWQMKQQIETTWGGRPWQYDKMKHHGAKRKDTAMVVVAVIMKCA